MAFWHICTAQSVTADTMALDHVTHTHTRVYVGRHTRVCQQAVGFAMLSSAVVLCSALNLEWSLMITANYVDHHNRDIHLEFMYWQHGVRFSAQLSM